MIKVEQLMTRELKTCGWNEALDAAAQRMWEGDLGWVPVLGPVGEVVGIITDRDIAMAAYLQGQSLRDIAIADVMTRTVQCCRPDDEVSQAEAIMREHKVRRLPVTDRAGALLGMISMNDIALEADRERKRARRDVRLAEIGLTLAEVCRHRGHAILATAQ